MSGFCRLLVSLLLGLPLVTLVGCNQKNTSGPSFAFERPEYLQFVCFAPLLPPKEKEYVALPAQCCRLYDPTSETVPVPTAAPPECLRVGNDEVGAPALHAVVTQSTRGEVASVDLSKGRVLDSDRQVPGYTFLDTGGLPSGIVVPYRLPRAVQDDPARNPISAGPAWTYVASAEQMQVRAIPTCRFRSGTTCGPDLLNVDAPDAPPTASTYQDRTRVQLTAAPANIELGPGPTGPAQALWVSLPDLGLLARIDLAEVPIHRVDYTKPDGTPGTADYAEPVDAFVLADTATGRRPKEPLYFRVPSEPSALPLEPMSEPEYLAVCGLGYEFRPAKRTLPLAPRVPPTASPAEPSELHFDDASGLLLVADRAAPVIHAFAVNPDGTLTALAGLATGSPVRTFVITPPVPVSAVDLSLVPVPVPPAGAPVATKRYLYASDAEGRVMVFDFVAPGGGAAPVLQPLLTPTPGTQFADRIELPVPVTALEVMDTRGESDYVCGQDLRSTLVEQRDAAKAALAAAAPADKPQKQAELNKYEGRLAIYDSAASDYLRGVFVVAAAASGAISIIDVYDLDASCRARRECCINDTCTGTPPTPGVTDNLTIPRTKGSQAAPAIRRHAVRRRSAGGTEASSSLDSLLLPHACRPIAEPYQSLNNFVCAPADPWTQLTQTWFTEFQGRLPNSQTTGAALQLVKGTPDQGVPDRLELLLPVEFQACSSGVEVGDLVAVMGKANEAQRSSACPDPTSDTAVLLKITQAFNDRLVVEPAPQYLLRYLLTPAEVQQRLLDCYPDLIGIELRAQSFLVTSSANLFLHRVITAPDGSCVVDPNQDPLLTSRLTEVNDEADPEVCKAVPKPPSCARQVFKNPYVEFTLNDPTANTPIPESREVAVTVLQGSTGMQVSSVVVSDGVSDALPASLRYESGLGNLFVVDSAGQGLRRYTLRPFQHDGQTFR